jgi:hypothetical protein
MTILEQIQHHLLQLPPDKQGEVLDFVVFLQQRHADRQSQVAIDQRQALQESLERLAKLRVFADIVDPSAWQREIRQDRSLPGRP